MSKPKNTQLIESKPKKTRQGQGLHSKPSHGRKKTRGQGRQNRLYRRQLAVAIASFTAGGSIAAGDAVSLDSAGFAHKATALSSRQATVVGLALSSGSAGSLVRVNADHVYTSLSGLTPGQDQYVGVASGSIVNYPAWISGVLAGGYSYGYLTRVGRAVSSSGIEIEVRPPIFVSASGL